MTRSLVIRFVLACAVALASCATLFAADSVQPEPITFNGQIASIMHENCASCHREGQAAPFTLLTYEDAAKRAQLIRAVTQSRYMPPWHATPGYGSFKGERRLDDADVALIAKWVEAGAPEGGGTAPEPPEFPPGWKLGEPDLVVPSAPYTVPADGQDKWWRPLAETGLTEERWVRAIEIKPSFPGGRKVVHHAIARLLQEEEGVTGLANSVNFDDDIGPGTFMEWAVGKEGEIFPDDAGKLMLPGAQIQWDIHYHAIGEEVPDDVVELGVYFHDAGYTPKYRTILHGMRGHQGGIDIPPGQVGMSQGFTMLKGPARLENFQPHMHMRGKAMSMEAVLPDGSRRMLSNVDNFRWNWHINYIYDEEAAPLLPGGTMIVVTAWHDNSTGNRENPDPRQWVGNGSRTVDEMAHAWVDVTYLEQDEYEQMVAEREAQLANDD